MIRTNREEEKATRELEVFLGFASFAASKGLRVRPGSAENRRPPEPDILCDLEGEGRIAFELVEIVDSGLAASVSLAVRKDIPPGAIWLGDLTLARIGTKLGEKSYTTPHPMELVAWANPFTTPPGVWLPNFEAKLRALHASFSQFRRIWVVNLGGPVKERGVWFVNPSLNRET